MKNHLLTKVFVAAILRLMDNQTPPSSEPPPSTLEMVTPVTAPPEQSTKPYGKNWKKLFLIYLIIGTIIYGVIYYFVLSRQNSQPYSQQMNKSQTSLLPSPSVTPDPTANWETYSNSKYGFSFKYSHPSQYQKYQINENAEKNRITLGVPQSGNIHHINVYDNLNQASLSDLVNDNIKEMTSSNEGYTTKNISIGGQPALEAQLNSDNAYYKTYFFVLSPDKKLAIGFSSIGKNILQTFKFTQ